MKKILITGGFGFIGSNFIKYFMKKHENYKIIVIDAMTYAAKPRYVENFIAKETKFRRRYKSYICDLANYDQLKSALENINPDHVIHFAAESHVCRSIETPMKFVKSNIIGTYNLLEILNQIWVKKDNHRFHHISTDEVYGELEFNEKELFHEKRAYKPTSPYAASKACSDHLVRSFFHTYDLDVTITNCSNNYGPNQDTEKLVPKTIKNILKGDEVTVYGTGNQVRDWLFVDDHCSAIDLVFHEGKSGETYCVGGNNELTNLQVINEIYKSIYRKPFQPNIQFVNNRPKDDKRYAIDISKIKNELGWEPKTKFVDGLKKTINWYKACNR